MPVGHVCLDLETLCPIGAILSSEDFIYSAVRVLFIRIKGYKAQSHEFPPDINSLIKNSQVKCNV
jgi:hypothetical protein